MLVKMSKLTRIPTNCPRCNGTYFTSGSDEVIKIGDMVMSRNDKPRIFRGEWVRGEVIGDNRFIDLWCPECDDLNKISVENGLKPKDKDYRPQSKLARFELNGRSIEDLCDENN